MSATVPVVHRPDADSWALHSLQPGDIVVYDYRDPALIALSDKADNSNNTNSSSSSSSVPPEDRRQRLPDTFRVVQWNVERGTALDGIIAALECCAADVICLQELDVHCRRSGYENVPRHLAAALRMQCVFVCEFEELDSPGRAPHNAAGPLSQRPRETAAAAAQAAGIEASDGALGAMLRSGALRHFHGNAVLSRGADLTRGARVLRHGAAGIDWAEAGAGLGEPRRGFRSALRVTLDPRDRASPAALAPVHLYCCHLEVFCGALDRARQLSDCLADAARLLHDAAVAASAATTGATSTASAPSFIIAGDLNTMAHGIVRLSPRYARDRLRLLSLGEAEAMWLQRKVLSRGLAAAVVRGCCPLSYRFPGYLLCRVYEAVFDSWLLWRVVYGFTGPEIAALRNAETCFYDPGDKFSSVTLDNPRYGGLVAGKLDWLLLSNLQVRPFRAARGGARPVDVRRLLQMGSLAAGSPSARYLTALYEGDDGNGDDRREVDEAAAARHIPRDGYVLFNEAFRHSDHKGLAITVRQRRLPAAATGGGGCGGAAARPDSPSQSQQWLANMPADTYPPYGAPYTWNLPALAALLLTRALVMAAAAAVSLVAYARLKGSAAA